MFLEDRDAGAVYPVTADGIYHGKPAGRNLGLDFVYEPEKTGFVKLRFAVDQGIVDVTDGKDEVSHG